VLDTICDEGFQRAFEDGGSDEIAMQNRITLKGLKARFKL